MIEHAWYADSYIGGGIWQAIIPANGLTGTANNCNLQEVIIGGDGVCSGDKSGSAYFQTITHNSGKFIIQGTGHLYYKTITTDPVKVMEGQTAQVTQVTTNNVYDHTSIQTRYGRSLTGRTGSTPLTGKPYFPDFNNITFPSNLTELKGATNPTIEPGTYYYSSISMTGGGKVKVKPGRTVIYVSGNITDDYAANELLFVDASGNALNSSSLCNDAIMKEYNLLIIVKGSVLLTSGSTKMAGTIIAKNKISTGSGSIVYDGQIMADTLQFSNSYNAKTNMRFIPLDLSEAEVKDTTFLEDNNWNNAPNRNPPTYNGYSWTYSKNKNWTAKFPVKLKKPANGSVSIPWTITHTSGPLANRIKFGNTILPTDGSQTGTLTFNASDAHNGTSIIISGGDSITKFIDIDIVDDGEVQTEVELGLAFGTPTASGGTGNITYPTPKPVKIFVISDDPETTKPTLAATTFSIREYHANQGKTNWFGSGGGAATTFARGNSIGTITMTRGAYSNGSTPTLSITGGNSSNWFTIGNISSPNATTTTANISTTNSYNADYEIAGNRTVTLTVTINDGTGSNNANSGNTGTVTINVTPWNDVEFTVPNPSISFTESLSAQTVDLNITNNSTIGSASIGGPDSSSNQNRYTFPAGRTLPSGVTRVSATQLRYSVPAGKASASSTFNVWVRDSAAYDNTDYFERQITVNVNATRENLYAPQFNHNGFTPIRLKENEKKTITISDLASRITDQDSVGISNYSPTTHVAAQFVSTGVTSVLKKGGGAAANIGVSVVGNDLVYDLSSTALLASYEFGGTANMKNGKFIDTIEVTIRNTTGIAPTSLARIPVEIDPINDIAPVANSFTDTIVKRGSTNNTNHTIPNAKFIFADGDVPPTGYSEDNVKIGTFTQPTGYTSTPTTAVSVAVSSNQKTFVVTVPGNYNVGLYGNRLTFTYRVVDESSYDTKVNTSSASYTITLIIDPGNADWVNPNNNYIIVGQGATATTLANAPTNENKSIMWNIEMSESGLTAEIVETITYPTHDVDADFLLESETGNFRYTHNGSDEINNTQHTDFFVYKAEAKSNSGNVASGILGYVYVYVNRSPKWGLDVTEKTGTVNANDNAKTFTVIDANDKSSAVGASLSLNKAVNLYCDDTYAEYEFAPDGDAILFRYNRDVTDTTYVTVDFALKESGTYRQWYWKGQQDAMNGDVFVSNGEPDFEDKLLEYNEDDNLNSITFMVVPNPVAVDYTMTVKEGQETSTLFKGAVSYINLSEGIVFLENVKSYKFVLQDSTQYGELTLNQKTGQVTYKNETYGSDEKFTYYIEYELDAGGTATTQGTVTIDITLREPYVSNDGSYYYDDNADGVIDRIIIPFDREVNLSKTTFNIILQKTSNEEIKTLPDNEIVDWTFSGQAKDETATEDRYIVTLKLKEKVVENNVGITTSFSEVKVNVTYDESLGFGEIVPQVVTASDSAAPVVKYAEYTRVYGGNVDTLKVEMSELSDIALGGGNLPFKFVRHVDNREDATDILYDDVNLGTRAEHLGDGKYEFLISTKDKIGVKDSIFVNNSAVSPDAAVSITVIKEYKIVGTPLEQLNPNNMRREIKERMSIKMDPNLTVYLEDATTARDGYIDSIKINLGVEVSEAAAKEFAEKVVLSQTRKFKINDAVVDGNFVTLAVDEDIESNGKRGHSARTSVDSIDLITLEEDLEIGLLTIEKGDIKISDKVAPVILKGIFSPADSILDVVFSEKGIEFSNENPYAFKDEKGTEYTMTLGNPTLKKGGNNDGDTDTLRYKVEKVTGIPYPLNGDSLQIVKLDVIKDELGNAQVETVFAPLELGGAYDKKVEVLIVPQPLTMMGNGPKDLDKNLLKYYGLENESEMQKGVAIVVEAKGPLKEGANSGYIKIIDQTGNAVTEKIAFKFHTNKEEGKVVGAAVWNGKNTAGRTVGASTYLALYEISIVFYDGKNEIPDNTRGQKIIQVISGGKAID
ncbi:MAG: hypothetical protein FWF51_09335 [Chitinivibrionia bacterium]|nr:hypothetical protein [Chitinivibrionia bacterium]